MEIKISTKNGRWIVHWRFANKEKFNVRELSTLDDAFYFIESLRKQNGWGKSTN